MGLGVVVGIGVRPRLFPAVPIAGRAWEGVMAPHSDSSDNSMAIPGIPTPFYAVCRGCRCDVGHTGCHFATLHRTPTVLATGSTASPSIPIARESALSRIHLRRGAQFPTVGEGISSCDVLDPGCPFRLAGSSACLEDAGKVVGVRDDDVAFPLRSLPRALAEESGRRARRNA